LLPESSIILLESSIMLLESSILRLESSIMLLESSIMLLESSIILPENIYSTGFTHDNCNMFIVQASLTVCVICFTTGHSISLGCVVYSLASWETATSEVR
jgi:hypothetical protein